MISHSVPGIYEGPNQSGQSADEEKEKRSRSHLLFSLEIFLFSILVLCVWSLGVWSIRRRDLRPELYFFLFLYVSPPPLYKGGIDSMRWHDDVKGSYSTRCDLRWFQEEMLYLFLLGREVFLLLFVFFSSKLGFGCMTAVIDWLHTHTHTTGKKK